MNSQKMNEFQALVNPLMKWLEVNCDTGASVYIDIDHAELNNTEAYVISEHNDFTDISPDDTSII